MEPPKGDVVLQPDEEGKLKGAEKRKAVAELMRWLTLDAKDVQFLPDDRNKALEQIKIWGRDPADADAIFTPTGIKTLVLHAFRSPSRITSRHALRALANAMLLVASTRQIFVDLGHHAAACEQMKSGNFDDEFLIARILFLATYGTTIDLDHLLDHHRLADIVGQNLSRHAKLVNPSLLRSVSWGKEEEPMEEPALQESLKLIFNVTSKIPNRVGDFAPSVPYLVELFWKRDVSETKPLDPPFGHLVNALMNLELDDDKAQSVLFKRPDHSRFAARLVELLGPSLKVYDAQELESRVTPLVTVLKKLHEAGPDPVKQYLRGALLPTEEDRKSVLGKSDTIPSRLLKNSTNPMTPNLREVISHLLFDLSDQDSQKFVDNVGYGFASGLLFQKNMPIPQSASEAFSTEGARPDDSNPGGRRPVNAITGQFLDLEKVENMPELSEEEKEREAERLFVLFERLKANGMIDLVNPVEQAAREGRLEELHSDDDDDKDGKR